MPAWWDATDALDNVAGLMEVYASILEVWELAQQAGAGQ